MLTILEKSLQQVLNRFTVQVKYDGKITELKGYDAKEELLALLSVHENLKVIEETGKKFTWNLRLFANEPSPPKNWKDVGDYNIEAVLYLGETVTLPEARTHFEAALNTVSKEAQNYSSASFYSLNKPNKKPHIDNALKQFIEDHSHSFAVVEKPYDQQQITYEGLPAKNTLLSLLSENSHKWPKGTTVFFENKPLTFSAIKQLPKIDCAETLCAMKIGAFKRN